MEWAKGILMTVFGGLFAFYISTFFMTTLITGTDAGSQLVQGIVPIAIAGGVAFAILWKAFKTE